MAPRAALAALSSGLLLRAASAIQLGPGAEASTLEKISLTEGTQDVDVKITNLARSSGRQELIMDASRMQLGLRTLAWIQDQAQEMSVNELSQAGYLGTTNTTAVVTHAGKDYLDYIDGATMLGLTLKKHLPEVPRFAMVIKEMNKGFKEQLRNAGWHIIEVEDWGKDHCGEDCGGGFLGRWGDSFEKLNVWRFPFERVLFLDADMYILRDGIQDILDLQLGPGQIAMTPDGCKPEHNSGMLLFRPDVKVFARLLENIAIHSGGREVLDQTVINMEYRDNILSMHKKYNCVDYSADWRCPLTCGNDTVIAHFTGTPKPTRQNHFNLEWVRTASPINGSERCIHTNRGNCATWPLFFCDMKRSQAFLSRNLQRALNETGECLVDGTAF